MYLKRVGVLFGLCVATLSAAPQLQLSTAGIGVLNITAGTNGPTQTVQANNVGDGTLNLSVSSSATWLAASIVKGAIQIALNTASLAPGSYTEFVTVNAPGAIDAPQNISVSIQVGGVPSTLDFYAAPNGGTANKTVMAQSMVNGQVTTASGGPWLSVALVGQGSFYFFYPYQVNVRALPGQPEGNYTGTVTFTGGSNPPDNKSVAVTMHITSQPIAQFATSRAQIYGIAGGAKVTQNVAVQNAGQGALTIAGGTGSASWLTATAVDNGTLTVAADPSGLAAGVYQGTVTLTSNAANAATTPLPVQFVVTAASGPMLSAGGVVDNTTFRGILAPGDIAAAFGQQLASPTPAGAISLPLQTNLAGVQVTVNGLPAPVYYTSAGQVDFVVPWTVQPGPGTVTMTYNGVVGNTVSTTIAARAPRILRLGIGNYGIIVNPDNTIAIPVTPGIPSHPAHIGDALVIYCIGLGATDQNVADGAGSPAKEPLARTPVPTVYFGGGFASTPMPGQVLFSGLTPGFVGLYQVNVIVPDGAPLGDEIGLLMNVDGVTSTNVVVAIGK